MVSSSMYAFFQSAIEVPHCSLQHLSWDTTNFVVDSLLQFIQCPWPSRVDLILKVAPQKKSQTDKSGDLGGQEMSPNLEMTWLPNNSRTAAIDCLAVCDVAPSCWNQASWSCGKLFNAGATKDCSISTYTFQKFPFFCVTLYLCHCHPYYSPKTGRNKYHHQLRPPCCYRTSL